MTIVTKTPRQIPLVTGLITGLSAPLQSLRFLINNKFLLFIGLAPQVLGLAAYVWLSIHYLLPYVDETVTQAVPESWSTGVLSLVTQSLMGLLLVVIYAIAFLPLVGAIASPLYDYVAARAFEEKSRCKLPHQGLREAIQGILSELVKLAVYYVLLALTLFVPPLAPFFLGFSIWYLGWDIMDRTLTLMNLPLRRRFGFGVHHVLACLGLGIWAYIPLVGAAFGFAFAAAGGISVSRLSSPALLSRLEASETDQANPS